MPYKLKKSLEQLGLDAALLYAMVPSAIFTVDTEKKITSWNRRAAELTGYSLEEALGQPCSFLGREMCGEMCGLFNQKISKPIMGRECIIKTKHGKTLTVAKNIDMLRDNKGNVIGGIESFEDISEQKEAEKVLRKQAEIVDFVDYPLFVVDRNLNYLYGNKNLLSRLNLSTPEQLQGKSYAEFHIPPQTAEFAEKIETVFTTGEALSYRYQSLRGENSLFLRTLSPHLESAGTVKSVSVSSKPMAIGPDGKAKKAEVFTVCSYCKKIANGDSEWEQLEAFFGTRFNLRFSHGICPPCADEAYRQLDMLKKEDHSWRT